jgi:hypothetical protein
MSETFKIGEIAIIHLPEAPMWHELEVEIKGPCLYRHWRFVMDGSPREGLAYLADVRGESVAIRPHQLRKKRPPREDLGDWELIPWARPTKETVR